MASNFRTFTITQARMGEPLQFQPALGSKELEELVDAYVIGSASKQDKLSQVTLDFFTHATVDFSTGSLSRQYNVAVSPNFTNFAFEQSPTQSQSSSFSPPIFTPSPASSMTFADSGYGSISMTPPTRTHGASGRVTKKPKKDTKKTAEVRLPGFSIMTKDGVDVTSSAGRGTKTKEQREHAHLMRIMKACDSCKRKKIRCDPSHRRQQTDMSRSSTSTTSSSRPNPSPLVSVPSLSHASPPDLLSLGNNAIDDFVLFPEDNTSSWNPADMSFPEFDENLDLSEFDFDISGLNDFSPVSNTANQSSDFSFDQQPSTGFQLDRSLGHNPYVADQYGLDQWASAQGDDLSVSHTRPHYSISEQDSGQLDSSWFDSGFLSTESPGSQSTPQSQSTSLFAENFWPNGSLAHPQIAQASSISLPSAEVDWSALESSLNAISPSRGLSTSSSMNRRERRNLLRIERARNASTQGLVDSIPSISGSRKFVHPFEQQHTTLGSFGSSPTDSWYDQSQSQSPGAANGGSLEYWGLESARALVAESMQALKSTPAAYQPIFEELQRLQVVLENVKSGDTERTPVLQQALVSQLEMLISQLQVLLTRIKNMLRTSRGRDHLKELSVQTKRLVSSLCATINNLQTQDTATGGVTATTNASILSSGSVHLNVSPPSLPQTHPQDAGVYTPKGSYSSLSSDSSMNLLDRDLKHAVILHDGKTITLDGEDYYEGDGLLAISAANGSGNVGIATIRQGPRYRLFSKPAIERLSNLLDGQSEQTILSDIDAIQFLSASTPPQQHSPPSDLQLARRRPGLFLTEMVSSQEEIINVSSDFNLSHQGLRQVQLSQERFSRTAQSEYINSAPTGDSTSQTDLNILAGRDHILRLPIPPAQLQVSIAQTVGRSGSESLESESSSPGAIPRTVLEHSTWYNICTTRGATHPFDGLSSYMVILASLVLLNYLQATSFILPFAAVLLAYPHPTPALITVITLAIVVAHAFPFSDFLTGLQSFATLAFMSTPLLKRSSTVTDGSFGGVLSSSRRFIPTSLASSKDTSLLSMFNELSLGVPAV